MKPESLGHRGRTGAIWIALTTMIAGSLLVAQATIAWGEGKGSPEKGAEMRDANAAEPAQEQPAQAQEGQDVPSGAPDEGGAPAGAGGSAGATHPPGNNGTVKIDGEPFDVAPDNEPHPGCTFEIDFYNYDEGDLHATYTVELIPPTDGGELITDDVFIGGDPNGGGDDDIDAQVLVDLSDELADSGVTAHPQQGYHVKLTVHAEGSIGSDVKHKVFWLECAPPIVGGEVVTPPGGNAPPPIVLGRKTEKEGPTVLGVRFARTGSPLLPILLFGLALIASGTSMTQLARKR